MNSIYTRRYPKATVNTGKPWSELTTSQSYYLNARVVCSHIWEIEFTDYTTYSGFEDDRTRYLMADEYYGSYPDTTWEETVLRYTIPMG